jgi:hypothetical protein
MSIGYKWVTNFNACEACNNLAQDVHPEKPARPHKKCLCSIVRVYDGSAEEKCVHNAIMIQRKELVGYSSDVENMKVVALYHEWEFTAICRNNTVVEVSVQIEISGSELEDLYTEIKANDFDRGYEISAELALREAMDEIESECPECQINQS